jgi:hypothetical protein
MVRVLATLTIVAAVAALAAPEAQQDETPAKVTSLLHQLQNGPGEAKRAAAEWELLKLAPNILPLLAPPDKATPQLLERLAGIRTVLEDLQPRTWKLAESRKMPVADALAELQAATGLALADRRQDSKGGQVALGPGALTYWEIAQALAKQTNSRLSFYQTDGQVVLVNGPLPKDPVDLCGLFRIAVKRVGTRLDFDGQTHTGNLGLEIAWEPRFLPYLIEVGKLSFQTGPQDQPTVTKVPAGSPMPVMEKNAKEFDVFFPGPPRSAAFLGDVRGHFVVTMPTKTLVLTFKDPKQGDKQPLDGVELTLTKVAQENDRWTVEFTVEVPAAAPKFDSFQMWLGSAAWLDQTDCQFERGAGENKEVLRSNRLFRRILGSPSATRITMHYEFVPGGNAGNLASWRLKCRVPGRMVEVTVPFNFAEIELP